MTELPPATLPAYLDPPPPVPPPPVWRSPSPLLSGLLLLVAGLAAWLLLPSPLGLAVLGAALVALDSSQPGDVAPVLGYVGLLLVAVASWAALAGVVSGLGVVLLVALGLLAAPFVGLLLFEVGELVAELVALALGCLRGRRWALA
ncbi:MAG: hypothetical protein ACREMX_07115 [Gemmatimonadales bacterium]